MDDKDTKKILKYIKECENIVNCINEYHKNDIDLSNTIITGTAFSNFYHDEFDKGDIDLFPTLKSPLNIKTINEPTNTNNIYKNATIITNYNNIKITIITEQKFLRDTKDETVKVFDFFHTINYYDIDTGKFYINEQVLYTIKNKLLLINPARRGDVSDTRINKFKERGFKLISHKEFKERYESR